MEMVIEGDRDAESLHHDLAGAVGEAPLLVGIVPADFPGGPDLVMCEEVDRRRFAREERMPLVCNITLDRPLPGKSIYGKLSPKVHGRSTAVGVTMTTRHRPAISFLNDCSHG